MNILIDETTAYPSVVQDALNAAIQAGDGNVHVRLLSGEVVKIRGAMIGASGTRYYLASTVGEATVVYVDDTEWIEGYNG